MEMSPYQTKIFELFLSSSEFYFDITDHRVNKLTKPFNKDYEQFVNHNKNCIMKLSKSDAKFYTKLCSKINSKKVCSVDAVNFTSWEADWIYFDEYSRINIVHPK